MPTVHTQTGSVDMIHFLPCPTGPPGHGSGHGEEERRRGRGGGGEGRGGRRMCQTALIQSQHSPLACYNPPPHRQSRSPSGGSGCGCPLPPHAHTSKRNAHVTDPGSLNLNQGGEGARGGGRPSMDTGPARGTQSPSVSRLCSGLAVTL